MLSAIHIHLAVNHLPVVGCLIGLLVLAAGIFLRHQPVRRTGLAILAFGAVAVVPAFLSGESAEELVEHRPGFSEPAIHDHEEAAELSLVFAALSGVVAGSALVLCRLRRERLERMATSGAALLAAVAFVLMARTAHLGGLIRHDELRGGAHQTAGSATPTETREAEEDDDD